MYNGIDRNSGLFDKHQADQLNNSFSNSLEKIESFHPSPLEPKYDTGRISAYADDGFTFSNSSFRYGYIRYISIVITPDHDVDTSGGSVSVGRVNVTLPSITYMNMMEKGKASYVPCYISSSGRIYVSYDLKKDNEYLISAQFITY